MNMQVFYSERYLIKNILKTCFTRDYDTKKYLQKVAFIFNPPLSMLACRRPSSGSVQVRQSFSYRRVMLDEMYGLSQVLNKCLDDCALNLCDINKYWFFF